MSELFEEFHHFVLFWHLLHSQLAKTHGSMYTLWFGWFPVIILNGYQAVKAGMTTHPEDVSGRMLGPFFVAMAKRKGEVFPVVNSVNFASCSVFLDSLLSHSDALLSDIVQVFP